jgi:8-oxo-dGTP diphosphatase
MILVTCAIIEKAGLVLVTQRSEKMALALKWEFPGGKLEDGESHEACLLREIMEELNIQIKIVEPLKPNTHHYPNGKEIQLVPFICEYMSGDLQLAEHADYKWLKKEALLGLDWAEADIPIVQAYINL